MTSSMPRYNVKDPLNIYKKIALKEKIHLRLAEVNRCIDVIKKHMDPYVNRKIELFNEKKQLWVDSKILQQSIIEDKQEDR